HGRHDQEYRHHSCTADLRPINFWSMQVSKHHQSPWPTASVEHRVKNCNLSASLEATDAIRQAIDFLLQNSRAEYFSTTELANSRHFGETLPAIFCRLFSRPTGRCHSMSCCEASTCGPARTV